MELKDRHIIVTGASRGIGLALVKKLIDRGVYVYGLSRSGTRIEHPLFTDIKADIANEKEATMAMTKCMELADNQIHGLVNNAGMGIFKKMENLTTDDWHKMFGVNMHGMFYCTKSIASLMKNNGFGHIINISSIAGLEGIPEATGYCATKFAVRGFSEALRKELRKSGVKVTCVYPGSVNTAFFEHYPTVTANETMLSPEDIATTLLHALEAPEKVLTSEIVLRPMNPVYTKE